jgi:hypothetical protein
MLHLEEPFKDSLEYVLLEGYIVWSILIFFIPTGLYFYLYVWTVSKHITYFWNITILFIIPEVMLCCTFFLTHDVSLFLASVLLYIAAYQHFKRWGEIGKLNVESGCYAEAGRYWNEIIIK